MTTTIQHIFTISKRSLCTLTASGILLLPVGVAAAQVTDDASAPARSGPSVVGTVNPAGVTTEANDEGDSSNTFEFVSPVQAVTTAPGAAASGGSPVVNPVSNTLSGSTVSMPTGNAAATLDAPRTRAALPATAKIGVCALLAGGLLILGIAVVRAMIQERARASSLEA